MCIYKSLAISILRFLLESKDIVYQAELFVLLLLFFLKSRD